MESGETQIRGGRSCEPETRILERADLNARVLVPPPLVPPPTPTFRSETWGTRGSSTADTSNTVRNPPAEMRATRQRVCSTADTSNTVRNLPAEMRASRPPVVQSDDEFAPTTWQVDVGGCQTLVGVLRLRGNFTS